MEQRNKVRGLAHDRNVAKVTLVAVPDRPGVARSVFEPLAEAGINVDMIVQNVGHGGRDRPVVHHPAGRAGAGEKAARPDGRVSWAPRDDDRRAVAKVCIVGAGIHNAPGLRGAHVRRARGRGHQHRDDLDLGDPDHDASSPRPRREAAARPPRAPSSWSDRSRSRTCSEARRPPDGGGREAGDR